MFHIYSLFSVCLDWVSDVIFRKKVHGYSYRPKVYLMEKYRFFRDGYVRPEITHGLDRDMALPVLQNFLGNGYFIEHGRGGTGNS